MIDERWTLNVDELERITTSVGHDSLITLEEYLRNFNKPTNYKRVIALEHNIKQVMRSLQTVGYGERC